MAMEVSGRRFRAQPGDYYIIPPGMRHFGLDETPFDAAFFHFVVAIDEPPPNKGTHTELSWHGALPHEVDYEALFRFLEHHFRRGSFTSEQLGPQLLSIMGQIAAGEANRPHPAGTSSHGLAGDILDLLRTSFREPLTNRDLAARLGYSYPHLERVFRENFRSSIHQELVKIRIDFAAHGLETGKSIKEVASEVGFNDYYYFLKSFKRLRGESPAAYRTNFQTRIAASGTRAADVLRQSRRARVALPHRSERE